MGVFTIYHSPFTIYLSPVQPDLTHAERERYARHLLIPDLGEAGQQRLKASSVLIIGVGGLGSPTALYLAAAGVGRIGLVDPDGVDRSNLQRQILFGEKDVGQSKLTAAAARLRDLNPHIQIDLHDCRFTPDNALALAAPYDVIVDGSDNFPTRFLSNDTAFFLKKPNVYGSIFRFDGQISVFAPHLGGPCYRCLVPELPPPGAMPSCNEAGVLGTLPGVIGSLQAMETLKLLLGIGEPPLGKLLCYDALRSSFRTLTLRRDPACRLCGDAPGVLDVRNPETTASPTCTVMDIPTITVDELAAKLSTPYDGLLIDVREPSEYETAHIAGSRLIPLGSFPDAIPDLPRDREIVIHCQGGMRSAKAVRQLLDAGFQNVHNVEGGMNAWQRRSRL